MDNALIFNEFFKNECKVEIIASTRNDLTKKDITTLRLSYPRYIHSEVMTHRQLSRNSASSRATPSKVFTNQVRENPAFFEQLGINQSGMNASKVLCKKDAQAFKEDWYRTAQVTADIVDEWIEKYNLHKQVANRILEPFMRTTTIITATEWDNLLYTRLADGVEPSMHTLAELIEEALRYATNILNEQSYSKTSIMPTPNISISRYHLPFVTQQELKYETTKQCLMHSVARCARCTILSNVTKKQSTLEEDENLYNRLLTAKPMHASPFEHQAYAQNNYEPYYNLRGGWMSYRYALEQAAIIRKGFDI